MQRCIFTELFSHNHMTGTNLPLSDVSAYAGLTGNHGLSTITFFIALACLIWCIAIFIVQVIGVTQLCVFPDLLF